MHGSGFVEMLAREMTVDLQAIRTSVNPGGSAALVSKGVSFGTLQRTSSGNWDTSLVTGLPAPSLASPGPATPQSHHSTDASGRGGHLSSRVYE
jgi:hypothetical protein